MRVRWHKFEAEGRIVEAQIWEPEQSSRKAILFCPGFPGRGATMFEQRHAAALTQAGYNLIVLRHSGTRLDGPDSAFMINNAARFQSGRTNGETHLGGGPSTMEAWLWEPYTSLACIAPEYDRIDVIGNSFGAVSSLWSLTRPHGQIAKIRNLFLLAGAQGVDNGTAGIMRLWQPALIANPLFLEKITLNDPEQISRTMKTAYGFLPGEVKSLPQDINLTYFVVEKDELLKLSDTEDFKTAIGGRGRIIVDPLNKAYPTHGILAHDTPDLTTAELLSYLS